MDAPSASLPVRRVFIAITGLMWLGQNTNHFESHPAVIEAMLASIRAQEFHAYAPPAGLEELRSLILQDLGLDPQQASVCVADDEGPIPRIDLDPQRPPARVGHQLGGG